MGGGRVLFVNPARYEYFFPVTDYVETGVDGLTKGLEGAVKGIGAALKGGERCGVFLGQIAMRHPDFAKLRQLAGKLAADNDARLGYFPEGANAVGAALAGALPHRAVGGTPVTEPGLSAGEMASAGAGSAGYRAPPGLCQ